MSEVVLFHHAQGLTPGCRSLADRLCAAGHVVHLPDLYEGRTFATLSEGAGHAEQVGFGTIVERGRSAAEAVPPDVVYAGLSLGVLPAQMLAQTRPGARGALLLHSCVPLSEFGRWPDGVPVQIHLSEGDEWVLAPNDDLEAAREIEATVAGAELFIYAGDRHLFSDDSLPDHDPTASAQLVERVLRFLG